MVFRKALQDDSYRASGLRDKLVFFNDSGYRQRRPTGYSLSAPRALYLHCTRMLSVSVISGGSRQGVKPSGEPCSMGGVQIQGNSTRADIADLSRFALA